MDTVFGLLDGFLIALTPQNLMFVALGAVIGMLVGVLPGLGPAPTIALLLPMTYALEPASAIIMLAGVYYGAYYGGTVTSVLLKLPGEAASVVTVLDGHAMAKQGRAGEALGISALASFAGGIIAVVGMVALAPPLAEFAGSLGPPEYATLAAAGLLLVTTLGTGSWKKGVFMAGFGLWISTIGIDPITGSSRFTLGSASLLGGIDFVAVAMGLFGLGEVLRNLEDEGRMSAPMAKLGSVWPSRADRREARGSIARGSVLGFFIGILPGGGGFLSSLASYGVEKRVSRTPERFGHGAIQGVAGPEAANNAGSTSAFIPLLTLGIPSNIVLALVFGALLIQGVTPGPLLITNHPDIFWGVIASMVIGNLILLACALPFVRVFVHLVRVRIGILGSVIAVITMVGVYTVNNSIFDMWVMLAFGVIGYVMSKGGYEPGPLILAMVLGPLLEASFRQSMLLADGSMVIFLERPLSLIMIVSGLLALGWRAAIKARRRGTANVPDEDREDALQHTGDR